MTFSAHKIRLRPTKAQHQHFLKCCGVSRFAWNWALAEWNRQYSAGEKPSELKLRRQLNAIKRSEFPWMYEVPKSCVQQAVKNLGQAWSRYFDGLKHPERYNGRPPQRPKFKKRSSRRWRARLDNGPGTFKLIGKSATFYRVGKVKTYEAFRFAGAKPLSATLVREGERWFLSVCADLGEGVETEAKTENQSLGVGIDLGLESALTLSTGEKFLAPKPLRAARKRLNRLKRSHSRKAKAGRNREKARAKVSRMEWRVAQIRRDWQHKTTTAIARKYVAVGMEDLNVQGMMKNHCLAAAIADVGWYETRRQLTYKTEVKAVDRFYASSKLCSVCGLKNTGLELKHRKWRCQGCGSVHDRDVNAAVNIETEALKNTASCAGINAFGDLSAGSSREAAVNCGR